VGTYNSKIAHMQGGTMILIGEDANGLPAILTSGAAANDGDIVTAIGADTLWADGSIYVSVVDGAGTIWQKRADTWTELTA
jgi:hypothetical protein